MHVHSLRLDEIVRRQPGVPWHEGVSVIQAICRELTDAAHSRARFPLAAEVSVSAGGVVSLLGRPSGAPGVNAAGQLLGEMLQGDVPAKLRQIHEGAVAPTPAFATVAAFSDALAYFERPDAQMLIEQLYLRATAMARAGEGFDDLLDQDGLGSFRPEGDSPDARSAAPASAPPSPGADVDRHTAALRARLQEAPAYQPARRTRSVWLAPVVGAAVIASGALLAYGRERFMPGRHQAESATSEAAAGSSAASVGARAGARPDSARPRPARPSSQSTSRADVTAATPQVAPANRSNPPSSGDTAWIVSATEIQPYLPDSRPQTALRWLEPAPAAGTGSTPRVPETGVDFVYSRGDDDVVPPVAIRPHLPSEPPADYPSEHLMVLELVVTTKGDVESVRLLTPPRTVNDFMIVSAAKAWIFAPAKREGLAVKYRHRIRFAVP
jgi:hypothetical protein